MDELITHKTKYFQNKVPFASNKEMLERALIELNLTNVDVSLIDITKLSQKMIQLFNKPISTALKNQQKDAQSGNPY